MTILGLPLVLASTQNLIGIDELKRRFSSSAEYYSCKIESGALEKVDKVDKIFYEPAETYGPTAIASLPLIHYAVDKLSTRMGWNGKPNHGMVNAWFEDRDAGASYPFMGNNHNVSLGARDHRDKEELWQSFTLYEKRMRFSFVKRPNPETYMSKFPIAPYQYKFEGTCKRIPLDVWAKELEEKYLKPKQEQQEPAFDPGLS